MIGFSYLLFLLCSIGGMLLIDRRFGLAFFYAPHRAALTLTIGTALFVLWDALGIMLGIFFDGESRFSSGIMLAPELPLEEVFFLFFLCYFALIVYRLVEVRWSRI